MTEFYLKDIQYDNNSIYEWNCVTVRDGARIYYKTGNNGNGFVFYAVEITGTTNNNDVNPLVECLFHGYAYFDGIRHLYCGDEQTDNYGYHYYANLLLITETLKQLRVLEETYCREYEK